MLLVISLFLLTVILPALFWWYFFIFQDRAEPEPRNLLLQTFFLGLGVAILTAATELILINIFFPDQYEIIMNSVANFSKFGMSLLILAGIVEEFIKFLAIREFIYSKKDFNQINDGVFYTVALAIGFIIMENSIYFYSLYSGKITDSFIYSIAIRGIATTLMHITSAVIIGYAFGRMKFTNKHSRFIIIRSLTLVIIFHVTFNVLVYLGHVEIAFAYTLLVFLYSLRSLHKKESNLVWKLFSPNKNTFIED